MTSQPATDHTLSSPKVSQQDVDQAAGTGRVEVLDWLWEESNGAVFPSSTGLQMAAAAGKIVTLEWAHSRGLRGFERLMDVAAWTGGLSVLKWLLANRIERCTISAINWAARRGHLKVLRWLRDNLGLHECTSEGLEAAAAAGHVRAVAWLLRNSSQGPAITPAVVGAASNGHADVLKLLLSAPQREQEKSGWAMALAVRGGHRECIRLLAAAGWPSQRPVADDDENGLVGSPAEDGSGNVDEAAVMPLKGLGRGGVSDDNETRRCSSSLGEDVETSMVTRPPAEIREEDGKNEQHARGAPPACAQQSLLPAAAETVSLRRHSSVASRPPSARLRPSGRVLSVDMALPGPQPEGATPSYLPQLLEAPVLHTPRLHSTGPGDGEQLRKRSAAPSCSTLGFPRAISAPGSREEGVDMVEGPEGICLEEWRWFWEGEDGVDDRNRCLDTGCRLDGFLGAEEAAAAGEKQSRVRDVWSPVSGVADAFEARLNLGALAEESQDSVISAYLAGLLRNQNKSPPAAACPSRHRSPQDGGSPHGSRPDARSTRPAPPPARVGQSFRPPVAAPTPLWSCQPLPPEELSPHNLAAAASAATICSAGEKSPRRVSLRRDRCVFWGQKQQRGRRRHPRRVALSGPVGGDNGRISAAGHPSAPPATASSGALAVAMSPEMRQSRRRARSAPGHPVTPSPRHYGCGRRGTGRSPHETSEWYDHERVAAAGAGVLDGAYCRQLSRRQQQEPSCCLVGRQGEDPESFLVCRAWGKSPAKAASRLSEGGCNADKPAGTPPPSPKDGSPEWFGEGCEERLGPDGRSQHEELIPRNMFLTRTHRRGHRLQAPSASRSLHLSASKNGNREGRVAMR